MANTTKIPERLPIKRMPDLYTKHIGRYKNGHGLFFGMTTELCIDVDGNPLRDRIGHSRFYAVLFLFGDDGTFHECRSLMSSHSLEESYGNLCHLLRDIGTVEYCDIAVNLFSTWIDGVEFGLVADSESGVVNLHPNSLITFSEPWDGEYFT
ncbi:MAG: hypothetical protein NT069_00575 [Planctomycetota bacterium]|nr:hypothetical protein [Planctomycetota bacterium]